MRRLRIWSLGRQLRRALGTSPTLFALFLFLVLLDHVVNLFDHPHFLCYHLLEFLDLPSLLPLQNLAA